MSRHPLVKSIGIAFSGAFLSLILTGYGSADNADCLMCHSAKSLRKTVGGKTASLYIDPQAFEASEHGTKACVDCHADLKNQPLAHKPEVAPVECARCHRTPGAYKRSVHGSIGKNGRPAAGCADCHPVHTGQTAVMPVVCAKCHAVEFADYAGSSHGGNTKAPGCVTCHGGHGIRATDDPKSQVSAAKVPMLCAKCHDDPKIMAETDLPTDRLRTYRANYHGIANKYGNTEAATCASCHGAHEALPPDNPRSSINARNLTETCGECHPHIGPNVAMGAIHLQPSPERDVGVYWVSVAYRIFVILMMLAFCGYIALDLLAHGRRS